MKEFASVEMRRREIDEHKQAQKKRERAQVRISMSELNSSAHTHTHALVHIGQIIQYTHPLRACMAEFNTCHILTDSSAWRSRAHSLAAVSCTHGQHPTIKLLIACLFVGLAYAPCLQRCPVVDTNRRQAPDHSLQHSLTALCVAVMSRAVPTICRHALVDDDAGG